LSEIQNDVELKFFQGIELVSSSFSMKKTERFLFCTSLSATIGTRLEQYYNLLAAVGPGIVQHPDDNAHQAANENHPQNWKVKGFIVFSLSCSTENHNF
jgi:hypothetical protein